jgi:hypothetical protein
MGATVSSLRDGREPLDGGAKLFSGGGGLEQQEARRTGKNLVFAFCVLEALKEPVTSASPMP